MHTRIRRAGSGRSLAVGALAGSLFLGPPAAADADRPNVLLILADDLGYSDLGCYGGEIPTPNLDRLARGGARFTQFCNSARSCPSRASLMTGLHPHQAGIGSFTTASPDPDRGPAYLGHLNDRCVTLAEVLGGSGYQTYMVGKWHLGEPGPIARGFDEFYGFTQGYAQDQWLPERYERLPAGRVAEVSYPSGEFYATDAFTDYALAFLSQARAKDDPWFLYLAHSAPHFPVQAPATSADRFMEIYRRGWDVLRAERFRRMQASGLATDSWVLTDRSLVPVDVPEIANGYAGRPNPAWADLPADRREDLARRMSLFAAMVSHLDAGVGRLLAELERQGELENTLILFLSDNGACYEWGPFGFDEASRRGVTVLHRGEDLQRMGGPGSNHSYGSGWANLSNTPFRLYKHFTHEGGICTPLIVHWPTGLPQRDVWVRAPGHVMDLMPTLCEATGAPYPKRREERDILAAEGVSLLPLLRGEDVALRSLAFEHQEARALRRGRWKVVWGKRLPHQIAWELYDLQTDRCETTNLATEHPERTAALATEWFAWARRVGVYLPDREQAARPSLPTPQIAGRSFRVTCRVRTQADQGVILAQGGRQQGYSLHLEQGRVVFSIRINEKVTAIVSREPVSSRDFCVEACLRVGGKMTLEVDGREVASGSTTGLIPVQPIDDLSVGSDSATAVGTYEAPWPLDGIVTEVRVETEIPREP